jgi:iron complex outermembrane receptor protein
MNGWRLTLFSCSAMVGFGIAGPAAAQQSTSDTPQSSSADLGEIVVTAQRREERLVDVPISITSLSANQLTDANVVDLAGIQKLTSDLQFDYQGPFLQGTIRGVGTSVVTTGSGPNVGIYIDGYFVPNAEAADTQLLNVDSVQVLKGPQGTLFGRNTTGGAILVNTQKPSQDTSGAVDVSYGSYNSQIYKGYFTTGVTDHIAFDVAAMDTRGNGYFTNIATDNDHEGSYDNWTARTGLKIDFTDKISVLLRYEHQDTNDPTAMEGTAYVQNGQPITLQAVIPGAIVATRPGDVSNSCIPRCVGFVSHNDIGQITPTVDLGFATLTSFSQYRYEHGTFYESGILGSLPIEGIEVPISDHTVSQEFLLTSKPGSRLQWTTGLYYFDYTDLFNANISLNGAPTYSHVTGSNTDTRSYAGYADVTYQVTDKLFATAGVRYTHDEVRDGYYTEAFTYNNVYAPTLTGNKTTPRAVLRYALDDNSNVYASFSRGYKGGIYNLGGDSLAPVQPETISAYEVGYKYAAHALSFDLATYYYKYTNLQVTSYGIGPGNVPIAEVTNAADSRIYGVEGDVRYEIFHGFEVNANAAYLNAKYTSFPNAPGNAPCFSSPAVCGANYGMAPPVILNLSGYRMQRAPEITSALGARYTMEIARSHLAFSSNLYYTSDYFMDLGDQIRQPAYATLGLRAEWTDPSDRLTLAVYGDNVTDKRYYFSGQTSSASYPIVWAAPAMVFGEIKYRFH